LPEVLDHVVETSTPTPPYTTTEAVKCGIRQESFVT